MLEKYMCLQDFEFHSVILKKNGIYIPEDFLNKINIISVSWLYNNGYIIPLEEWREQQIDKVLKDE
jgi:hypothetical protein